MSVEEDLKQYILQKYKSIRAFTQEIGIPYSTLDTMFKRGIQGAGVGNIIKICKALEIDINALDDGIVSPNVKKDIVRQASKEITEVVNAYEKADTKTKNIVRYTLDLPIIKSEDHEYTFEQKAARNEENKEIKFTTSKNLKEIAAEERKNAISSDDEI